MLPSQVSTGYEPPKTGRLMIVFHIDSVTKDYPRQSIPANKGISLRIHCGEIFGLPGDNGAAKTTLVRQMVALLPPSARHWLVL